MTKVLSDNETAIVAELLELAADQFSHHGCNDFKIANTDENWKLWLKALNDDDPPQRPRPDQPIYAMDWLLMRYLSKKLKDTPR